MIFSSILFLMYYLPSILLVYLIAPKRMRNFILLVGSLFFYAWGEPVYVGIMIFSIVSDYFHGKKIGDLLQAGRLKKAKYFLLSSIVINLLLLGFFKYVDFILQIVNEIFNKNIPLMQLPLPIGISFYTFQTMSYTIDIYRGKAKAQKNIVTFGAFVTMFPQLIAGPIVKYQEIEEQLQARRTNKEDLEYGIRRFVTGLGKKVLLANGIGQLWDIVQGMGVSQMTVLMAWMGILAFSFQIYFDFSGYSDMAIGLGRIFGFTFPENFNYPYIANSVTDFWRRWHISLSSWFKEYVYIPLGGNRVGIKRQIINLIIVWSLTGIWHGASWNFLLWGMWFAFFLILEKLWLLQWIEKRKRVVQRGYALGVIIIGWVIFTLNNMGEIFNYLCYLFGISEVSLWNRESLYLLSNFTIIFILCLIGATPVSKRCFIAIKRRMGTILFSIVESIVILWIFLLSMAYIVDASYNPFLYFRF
ncbi:MAG: MBOAT family O-acyltransferase [Eubacteriales bacterium]